VRVEIEVTETIESLNPYADSVALGYAIVAKDIRVR
jgi:hypothetical protein